MNTWVVEAQNLHKTFAWTPVLSDISCRIAPAEVVGIFGPNGAGKTTLLRLLATLLEPTSGSLTLFGSASSELAVRRKIGFLGHESYLYPDLTPEENLTFYGKAYRVPDLKRPHCATIGTRRPPGLADNAGPLFLAGDGAAPQFGAGALARA